MSTRDRFFIGLMNGSSPDSAEWVFEETGEHTCGAGSFDSPAPGAHEPYCGVVPVAPLAEVVNAFLVASSAGSAGWEHARISGEYAAAGFLSCAECDPSGGDSWRIDTLVDGHRTWLEHRVAAHGYRANGPGSAEESVVAELASVIRRATDPDGELRVHAVGTPGSEEIAEVVGTPEAIARAVYVAIPSLRVEQDDQTTTKENES